MRRMSLAKDYAQAKQDNKRAVKAADTDRKGKLRRAGMAKESPPPTISLPLMSATKDAGFQKQGMKAHTEGAEGHMNRAGDKKQPAEKHVEDIGRDETMLHETHMISQSTKDPANVHAENLFGALDSDKDGSLSRREYLSDNAGVLDETHDKATGGDVPDVFRDLDRDKSGKLNRAEFSKEGIVVGAFEANRSEKQGMKAHMKGTEADKNQAGDKKLAAGKHVEGTGQSSS